MIDVMERTHTEASGTGGRLPPYFPVAAEAGNGDGDDPDNRSDFIVIFTDGSR